MIAAGSIHATFKYIIKVHHIYENKEVTITIVDILSRNKGFAFKFKVCHLHSLPSVGTGSVRLHSLLASVWRMVPAFQCFLAYHQAAPSSDLPAQNVPTVPSQLCVGSIGFQSLQG